MHCRICDDEYEARELSEDQCCYKCVEASSDLFVDDDVVIAIVSEDDLETLVQNDINYWDAVLISEGQTSDYE